MTPTTLVKRELNEKRIEIQEIKSTAGKLGEKTTPVTPEDVAVMFSGKVCDILIKQKVAVTNLKKGYLRDWETLPSEIEAEIEAQYEAFTKDFEAAKRRTVKLAEQHPLWDRLKDIKGFSAYQMALMMAHIKNPDRFATPSKLCVWAGVASISGHAIAKRNLAKIKEHYYNTGKDEFKGFNTNFSGRMFTIVDCLLRARGYFYYMYSEGRKRLVQRCANNEETFVKDGKVLMKGKNNQSLELFTHANMRRRVARTLLHLFYTEWRTLNGLETRNPYPIDYLGHNSLITLDTVLNFDRN